jgi:PAS domain S-box-containing protein
MDLQNIRSIIDLIEASGESIVSNWLNSKELDEFFKKYINQDKFKTTYALNFLKYFIESIKSNEHVICKELNRVVTEFKDVDVSELFVLYMKLKDSILDFIFTNPNIVMSNINVKDLFNEVTLFFENNMALFLKHYNITFDSTHNEKLLKEYRKAVDASSIVSVTDTKGNIKYANDKFCEISGYKQEELIGKPHNIVRHPDMPKEAFANLWETIKSKKVWHGVVKNRNKEGGTYIVDATVIPILDESNEIIEYIAVRHDVTTLTHQSKILEEYRRAVDVSNIVSITDTKGIITYVNDKFCEISGFSREDLIGKPHNVVRHPSMPSKAFEDLWRTIRAKKVWNGIVKNRRKDDKFYIVDATIVPILDENDEIIEYIGIRHDLTELMIKKEKEKKRIKETLESIRKATSVGVETVIKSVPLPTIIINTDNIITSYNDAFLNIFDMQQDTELINALKSKELNVNGILKEEDSYIYSDDIFDWKEHITDDSSEYRVKIKTSTKEYIFSVKLGSFVFDSKQQFVACFKPFDLENEEIELNILQEI